MLECSLDVVTCALQTCVSVRKGFGYILFILETSAEINEFLSE